ncbi:MAG: cation diffusion facilitator family transporter [Acidobacteria bacterium]|nr:cation diffusion facilitator family transporter [Acidobacteriota bacterium]
MAEAHQIGKRVAVAGMVVSGLLAALKISVGWFAGSTSVVADGIESAADVVTSGIVLFGLEVASRPPDDNHPYGHGRFETLTGLAVGLILAITGGGICFRSLQMINGQHAPPASYAMWALLVSIVAKAVLSSYKFRNGRKIHSAALVADAWNDSVDILSGAVAMVAVGLTIFDPARFLAADHCGGAAVGLIVIFLGIQVIRETVLHLMDTMPDGKTLDEIRSVAGQVPGVHGVEKCYARKTGLQYHVDLHVEVDQDMTVRASHQLAHEVRQAIVDRLDWVADVLVHVEPYPKLKL